MVKASRLIPYGLLFFYINSPVWALNTQEQSFYWKLLAEEGLATHINGFNQIPRGGENESSSYKRPNFNELNIRNKAYHTLGIGAEYKSWQVLYSHAAIHLEKNAILNQSLFTHGKSLPIDTLYHFNIALNKHQVRIDKQFYPFKNKEVNMYLKSSVDWLAYHYHFYPLESIVQSPAPSSYREFTNLSLSIGTEVRYQWHPYFSSSIFFSSSLPKFHLQIVETKLIQRFHFIDKSLSKLTPYVGISYLKIDLEDNQGLANHLRYIAKPYFFSGVEFLII